MTYKGNVANMTARPTLLSSWYCKILNSTTIWTIDYYRVCHFLFTSICSHFELIKDFRNFFQINSKLASKENPHYTAQQDLVKRKYTDSVLQIPYTDKTR